MVLVDKWRMGRLVEQGRGKRDNTLNRRLIENAIDMDGAFPHKGGYLVNGIRIFRKDLLEDRLDSDLKALASGLELARTDYPQAAARHEGPALERLARLG